MRLQKFSAHVLTFKLAAALEQYEVDVSRLVDTWLDTELYRQLEEELKELRLYCASLPKLTVSWVAVLLSRARLLHALSSHIPYAHTAAPRLLYEHLRAVETLRKRCLRMLGAEPVLVA
jgi:hypothetical protein